jgi:hypothetical protein
MNLKQRNQYNEFEYKIQQYKMKEIWDNEEDKMWNDT